MDFLIIFIAKYLVFISAAVAVVFFLRQPRARQKEMLIFVLILFPLSYILAKISSRFYFDPRPFAAGNFTPLIGHASDNGFPSDHALLGAAIALAIFHFNKELGTVLLLLAAIVGAARVAAGVHHAVDIIGSIVVVFVVFLIILTFRRFNLRN